MPFVPVGIDENSDLPQEARERLAATIAVRPGGTTGQVLKKSSDVDHEYEWADDLSVAPGSANNPHTDANAARNNALQKNFWQTSTEPVNWLNGDEWIEIA